MGSLPEDVVKMYCYIQGTFVIPRHYVGKETQIGNHVSQTGVGPYNPDKDDVSVKAYYQWVPFVLFLQALMFYLPHIIYMKAEGKKVRRIMGSLNLFVLNREERKTAECDLSDYYVETMGIHDGWSLQVLLAHCVYLINVVGQMFFTDAFLGYEFSKYGLASAISQLDQEPSDRIDPMSEVFPRVTKCTFHKYGPSGGIQRHDIQCVLPINIINEKLNTAPKFKLVQMDIDLALITRSMSYGDWKLCYHIIRNMDSVTAAEWLQCLTSKLREEKEKKVHDMETLPLKSTISFE